MDGVIQQIHSKVFDKETVEHMDREINIIINNLELRILKQAYDFLRTDTE